MGAILGALRASHGPVGGFVEGPGDVLGALSLQGSLQVKARHVSSGSQGNLLPQRLTETVGFARIFASFVVWAASAWAAFAPGYSSSF